MLNKILISLLAFSSVLMCAENRAFADPGKVILLLGTSTAGKTTIIEQIKKLQPNVIDYGIDIGMRSAIEKMIKIHAPDEYNTLVQSTHPGKVLALISGEKIWLNKGLSEQQNNKINTAIDQIITQYMSWSFSAEEILDSIYDHILGEA